MATMSDESKKMYSIPNRFAELKLSVCPVCFAKNAGWLVGNDRKLFFNYLKFQCKNCGTMLSIQEDDITGAANTTLTLAGKMKKKSGKQRYQVYVTVEKIEYKFKTADNMTLEGSELTIDEIREIAEDGAKILEASSCNKKK